MLVLSIPVVFLCAVYKDRWFDKLMRGLVFVTTAMPAYWVGLLLMWLISVKLGLLPTNGSGTLRHLILPAFTVALSYISTYIRLIRNNMLENMKQDYVLYANVRGLPQRSIWVKHMLKNSMHTCIVAMGMSIPQMIAGTIVVENVFSWPGLGFVGAGLGLTIARYIGAIATIWVLMVGLNPALRLSLKGYFKPFNFAIIWEVMGIGIPASIESVLFNADPDVCRRDGHQRYRRQLYRLFGGLAN